MTANSINSFPFQISSFGHFEQNFSKLNRVPSSELQISINETVQLEQMNYLI